ncbi:hypothetical protein Tco_1042338 [Tanacetum coccineum]|uniref:Uncharacterized protein n=1 Tax=Tanacetum coccineum TaxID=301880 RepID=A0ABQ5GIS6_9ASTR
MNVEKYRRIGMKAVKDKDALQKIVDSWFASSKNLWKLVDCGMSSTVKIGLGYGIKSNAEVLDMRFKQVEYKGVPHPLSGDYTPREQEDIDDSLYEYGKHGPQPKSPSPTESNASSIVFSICPSNDSDGELGTVSNANSTVYSSCQSNDSDGEQVCYNSHPKRTQPQVPEPLQTVDPSCAQHVKTPRQPTKTPVTPPPIPSYNRQNWNQRMEREFGAGSSFERKPCFVCGSLSHLIKDCDYYEKKMAREAAIKRRRVVNTNDRQATPAWNNTNRINKQISSLQDLVHVNAGHKCRPKPMKPGSHRDTNLLFVTGPILKIIQEHSLMWDSVTFGRKKVKGSISGKRWETTIRLDMWIKLNVLFTKKECFVVSLWDFKMPE